MMFFLQLCIDALLLGGIYTLMAIGLSLIQGVARVINFAHGESVMLGAYGAFWCFQLWGIDPLIALPLLCLIGTLSGIILFRMVVARVLQAPQENQLLVTFGISLILQSIALICWSADERSANPPYALSSFGFGDLVVGGGPLIGFSVAAVLVTGLFLWLRYAELGRAARAIADNRDAALLMGINVPALYALVFGLSTALGVATGAVMSFLLPITPLMGFPILIKGFAIIVLGGLGSVTGTVLGAFVLSFAETAIGYYVPDGNGWAEAVSFALLFFTLILRPRGILGRAAAV
jgi:branched-chain amino acid transport system permease protein